ncbi:MAG TPA: FAD-dependent oxidoreductase [Acidimicrobiia bacterium]|nr:FAD-dependent oxidoreductase [Acidimicrobiia bacterium]
MSDRLVVIGGDAAGMTAAATARRRRPADQLDIVAFEQGNYTSYSACGIPYLIGGLVDDVDALIARAPEEHARRGIDARVGHVASAIDTDGRRVLVRQVDAGVETWEPFDQLVVATGSTPRRPPLPGSDAAGIFGVQTLDDGLAVRAAAAAGDVHHAVVIGGGYIGLELGEALVRRGLRVALVEAAPQPMSSLDPEMGALVADALRDVGIDVHVGARVEGFELEAGRVTGVCTASQTLPADLVILGLGVDPNSGLARDAGIPVGASGGIVVDDHQRTRVDGIFAAGDCSEAFHRVSRRPVVVALGTHANKQGRVVGINATGGDARFPGVLGTAASKICKYEVARTGLNQREAADAGFDAVGTSVDATTRAGYYPDAAPIRVRVVAEVATGRLLGAQIVGEEGAAKRVDVLAAAIWNDMTVGEVASMDLSYAPPFAPVWDPTLMAARRAAAELG